MNALRNLLSASPDEMDLIAIDIQRERDVDVGTLNQTRIALTLKLYTSFAQLTSDPTVQANLQAANGNINNVDLFIGVSPRTMPRAPMLVPPFRPSLPTSQPSRNW